MATMYERVQAGAALLDKVLPDWWNGKETPTIDLEILDLNSQEMCTLGQCFGDYKEGCDALDISAWGSEAGPAEATSFGFLANGEREGYSVAALQLAGTWRAEIKRRRAERKT